MFYQQEVIYVCSVQSRNAPKNLEMSEWSRLFCFSSAALCMRVIRIVRQWQIRFFIIALFYTFYNHFFGNSALDNSRSHIGYFQIS
jgi:hypothetical protein